VELERASNRGRRRARRLFAAMVVGAVVPAVVGARTAPAFATPIQHVVFVIQENHSFDNLLGAWCVQTARCDGATSGALYGGGTINLAPAKDQVVQVIHSSDAQTTAIDAGHMDGFSRIQGCTQSTGYKCYSQYSPSGSSIRNVTALAGAYVVSDRTFEDGPVSSWGMHVQAVAATSDGFIGAGTPHKGTQGVLATGWGCDSGRDTTWLSPQGTAVNVPACVPDPSLSRPNGGAYRPSPVPYVPTIMDRLDASSLGLTWKFYGGQPGGGTGGQGDASGNGTGYGWATCPTFAECLYRSPSGMAASSQFATDAAAGTLPNFSVVTPAQTDSQHNGDSMAVGDNWIGHLVSAVQGGPDWSSTAIFITWDDCGCFYDHTAPPSGLGIRVPMLVVSPYARSAYTDSTPASYASVLAFTEHSFGLAPLTSVDGNAYDYAGAFSFSHAPQHAAFRAVTTTVPPDELRSIAANPPAADDPT
jgi:phospholipase C